jgi:hypothetical protein
VPLEWLKGEWRSRGLLKHIQLTISCCLGAGDLTNVIRISGPANDIWLGSINPFQPYSSLVGQAEQSKAAGALLPLPPNFEELRFDPFIRRAESNVNSGLWIAVPLAENTFL